MKKIKYFNFFVFILLLGSFNFPYSESDKSYSLKNIIYSEPYESDLIQHAGIARQLPKIIKGGWKSIKNIKYKIPNIHPNVITLTEISKNFEKIKIQEKISPKNKQDENQKNIHCLKKDAYEIRMYLYEQENSNIKLNKTIPINISEYDIHAMQEISYIGNDGLEYINFIIPRKPQYIFNEEHNERIFECMIFNVPKDIDGKWKLFKTYLIAFMNDLMKRPFQLWDEYNFKRGLEKLNINYRDIKEIKQYLFVQIIQNNKNNENTEFIKKQIA